jgi:iron complex transport system substrate-binding protein
MRIVSLLPSATEMICALGLGEQLVGVTHECDYPPAARALPKVTTTLIPTEASSAEIDALVRDQLKSGRALYGLDIATLEALAPDLIVTQALCDVCAVAEEEVKAAACRLPGRPRVLNLEPSSLEEVFHAIQRVADLADVARNGRDLVASLRSRVDVVARRTTRQAVTRVALLEWLDPPFSCGHWSPELVRLAGGVEGLGREGVPSRTLEWSEVIAWQPEVVMVACCGFTVDRSLEDMARLTAVPGWATLPAVVDGRVYATDGSQFFSRPGPRLVDSLEILAHAIDADRHPLPGGVPPPVRVSSFVSR